MRALPHSRGRDLTQAKRLQRLFLNSNSKKAAELSGEAGGFSCPSLHRSQISEEL